MERTHEQRVSALSPQLGVLRGTLGAGPLEGLREPFADSASTDEIFRDVVAKQVRKYLQSRNVKWRVESVDAVGLSESRDRSLDSITWPMDIEGRQVLFAAWGFVFL